MMVIKLNPIIYLPLLAGEIKKEKVWKIYTEGELIQPINDFEVLIFKPGYQVFVKTFKK